jgi:hypothetical protein
MAVGARLLPHLEQGIAGHQPLAQSDSGGRWDAGMFLLTRSGHTALHIPTALVNCSVLDTRCWTQSYPLACAVALY